jgi:putative salt-induced outer membrane protein YdiY
MKGFFGGFCLMLAALPALVPSTARAQTPPAQQEEVPDRWGIALDLGFNGAKGNNSFAILTTGLRVKRLETASYELEWSTMFRYGESDGDVIARNIKTGLTFDLHPEDLISPFVFADAERDAFRKLDVRTNAGAGVKYILTRSETGELSISGAALHDYENFTQPAGDSALMSRSNARWSVRGKASKQFSNGLRFENTSWYKPVWDDGSDYNIDTLTKVSVRLSSRIGLNVSWNYRRDSTPPPNVKPDDQTFQAGVTIEL